MSDFIDLHPTLLQLANALKQRIWMLSTAESCTGGLIAAACTDLPGSSEWFDRGFVTYSNESKTEMLGVHAALIAQHGAISEEVVQAMAQAAVSRSQAQIAIAVSGIAGPDGGSLEKPVGTVWVAWKVGAQLCTQRLNLTGDRADVRAKTMAYALVHLLQILQAEQHATAV